MSPAASHTASASGTIRPPAATKSSSVIAEPAPAPACTTTSCPACTSSRTPSGVAATRYSCVLTSVGIPTITSHLQVVEGGAHAVRQLLYLVVREHQRRRDLQGAAGQHPPHDAPSAQRGHDSSQQ